MFCLCRPLVLSDCYVTYGGVLVYVYIIRAAGHDVWMYSSTEYTSMSYLVLLLLYQMNMRSVHFVDPFISGYDII